MKSRYKGICTLVLFTLVVVMAGFYYFSGAWQSDPVKAGLGRIPPDTVKVPSTAQLRTMRELMPRLTAMAYPSPTDASAVSMVLFGQEDAPVAGGRGDQGIIAGGSGGQHQLSITVLAGAVRFCILDGTFLVEGAVLEDGAVLGCIENKRVQLVKQGQVIWVPLKGEMADKVSFTEDLQKGQT